MEKDDLKYQLCFGEDVFGGPRWSDMVGAAQMDEPVDYGEMGKYLTETRGVPPIQIKTEYHSTWLDNTKAKLLLGWRPEYDMKRLIDSAWEYVRAQDDPRKVWYPG